MKTKVLILHTHIGYGIKMTAVAIAEKLNKSGRYEVRMEDVEDMESGFFASIIQKTYSTILAHISALWGFLYHSNLILSVTLPFRKFIASFKAKRILQILREFQPAVVISTQTIPSGIVSYLKSKGLYHGKLVVVFSDYHLQRFWLYKEVDLYICNVAKQVEELRKLKIPDEKIALSGTLIMDEYFEQVSKEQSCQSLGLLTSMPVVLVTSGGNVRNFVKEIFLQLLRSPKAYQIVVVCGHNKRLKEELEKISSPNRHPVKIFGYMDHMGPLMSAADVLVGKTGGPTMAEAVVKKLPMVITDVRPGHELANLEYLLENEIVQYARIPREAVFLVEQILDKKISFNHERSFRKIVKPNGSSDFISLIDEINPNKQALKVSHYEA
ncbi:MAG: hypothetical protein HYV13_01970 [Candidatus Doudnabacteria bacterium]|nr:hypothetical protein [Candidatus Doudnabacteria bacterium]